MELQKTDTVSSHCLYEDMLSLVVKRRAKRLERRRLQWLR